ncbi:MAG: flagellar basal body-associated FliL family protein [Nitrospinae bacterium]|nr:flagellar basal body-associated FliL family protein [Nitrospinota bacterium]MBI3813809.1 flagellar basal body-associated FliL family protein [Nitrospinota bacterium]
MAKKRKTELDIDLIPAGDKKEEVKTEEGEGEKEKIKTPLSKKKIIILISSAVAVILIIAIIIFFTRKPKKEEPVKKTPPAAVEIIPLYSFEPFFVPLSGGEPLRQAHDVSEGKFLKISVAVELSDKDVTKEIERNIVLLRENIFFILKTKGLKNFQDKNEREKLAKDITTTINMALQAGTVIRLYFTEFLVQ